MAKKGWRTVNIPDDEGGRQTSIRLDAFCKKEMKVKGRVIKAAIDEYLDKHEVKENG